MTNFKKLDLAIDTASRRLISEMGDDGLWRGKLSSSAVSTAVSSFALLKLSPDDHPKAIAAGMWLVENMNPDGGWGDTPASPSNLSATLLSRAALTAQDRPSEKTQTALAASARWLSSEIGGISASCVIDGIKKAYGKDLTFSVPILTFCALSGMFGKGQRAWQGIPALPFELSLFSHRYYRYLNLPVVSYAIPALIAVGIAHFRHCVPRNPLTRHIREFSIMPALKKLGELSPTHGGFLEAAPLTAFVASCLGCSGFGGQAVVEKAIGFLRSSMRDDGSWPIDTDLSMWLTSLAVRALGGNEDFTSSLRVKAATKLRGHQFREVHPFTHARPGGWAWTSLPGGVPDADDTAGALSALAVLDPGNAGEEVPLGIEWLISVMNKDGGVPTFCKGWGFLPFDRSCPDISAHTLQAFLAWMPHVPAPLRKKVKRASAKIISYLEKSRDADMVWTPLWFGDQNAEGQTNRVYGTSAVLLALADLPRSQARHLSDPAARWLIKARNDDGGWGGEPGTASLFETTAQAVAALASYPGDIGDMGRSVELLCGGLIENDGLPPSSPIGFYFASLWYDEKLYPLLFGLRALNRVRRRLFL